MNYLKEKTTGEQIAAIKNRFPQFRVIFISHTCIKVLGSLKPTARSKEYKFEAKYCTNKRNQPSVRIIDPILITINDKVKIPHLFSDGTLCLFRSKYGEFKSTDLICDTIIPWISLWLYHYEVWHLTGEWLGGGEHPI